MVLDVFLSVFQCYLLLTQALGTNHDTQFSGRKDGRVSSTHPLVLLSYCSELLTCGQSLSVIRTMLYAHPLLASNVTQLEVARVLLQSAVSLQVACGLGGRQLQQAFPPWKQAFAPLRLLLPFPSGGGANAHAVAAFDSSLFLLELFLSRCC